MNVTRMTSALASALTLALASPAWAGIQSLTITNGLSISNQTFRFNDNNAGYDRDQRTGLMMTAGLGMPLAAGLEFTPEVAYLRKGSNRSLTFTTLQSQTYHTEESFLIEYISVRTIAKWHPPHFGSGLFLAAGARTDVKVHSSWSIQVTPLSGTPGDDPYSSRLRAVVFGGLAGIGSEFGLSPSLRLVIQGLFDFDISKAFVPSPQGKISEPASIRNQAAEVTAGLKFRL